MPEEADAEKGLISTSSPIGRAILNKEEGDEVKVVTPNGNKTFELHQARHDPRRGAVARRRVMPAYSPERRTAVVLSGTGIHGAYHAGRAARPAGSRRQGGSAGGPRRRRRQRRAGAPSTARLACGSQTACGSVRRLRFLLLDPAGAHAERAWWRCWRLCSSCRFCSSWPRGSSSIRSGSCSTPSGAGAGTASSPRTRVCSSAPSRRACAGSDSRVSA